MIPARARFMPTYEYECKHCGTVFDLFQSITASPLRTAKCETCKVKRPVRRLISSGGGVIFKGSGFYQTDYRSDSYKKAQEADKPAGSSPAKDDAGKKSETKPTGDKDSTPAKASPESKPDSSSKEPPSQPKPRKKKP
jgi:putative FmdB family regulatory protein